MTGKLLVAQALLTALLCTTARPSAATTATTAPAGTAGSSGYDPALVLRIGATYARYRFDLQPAFVPGRGPLESPATLSRSDERRLHFRTTSAIDDVARERITGVLAGGDGAVAMSLQKLFAHDEFLDQATQAIRSFGMRETDLAEVTSALVIAGYNTSHATALSAAQGFAVSRNIRAAMLASTLLPTLDDATKQTIVTEMAYQVLLWESDASQYGYGRDPANLARLRQSIAYSLSQFGIALERLRPTTDGLVTAERPPA